jgi:prophage DNA circulation protein
MEIEDENWTAARELCHEMRQLAEKIRPGSEQPFAEAFQAICRHVAQPCADMEAFDRAMQALRVADSKHRLAFAAVVAADVFLKQGAVARARQLAQEALEASRVLNRVNGQVGALAVLVEAAARNGEDAQAWREQLRALMAQDAGKWARSRAESALALHSRIN